MTDVDLKHTLLNEKYMKYYRKRSIPKIYPYHCRRASDLVKINISASKFILENVDETFYPCINEPNSLTNAIRCLEHDEYYLSEHECEPIGLDDIAKIWRDICQKFFDSQLLSLTYNDIGAVCARPSINIVDNVQALNKSKDGNIPIAVQMAVPFFKKNAGSKDINDFAAAVVNAFKQHGYNFSSLNVMQVKKQPLEDSIEILLMTFEAVLSEVVDELSDDIYHITTCKALKSIKANGIVPHECTSGNLQHPKRVYLFSNAAVNNMLDFMSERFGSMERPCMLRMPKQRIIELDGFKTGEMKFYVDPMFTQRYGTIALFTDKAIPADVIDDEVVCFKFDLHKMC
jgi:hypothetical protein